MNSQPEEIVYCTNMDCPFGKCFRHHSRMGLAGSAMWTRTANYTSFCKLYLLWLADDVAKEKKTEQLLRRRNCDQR